MSLLGVKERYAAACAAESDIAAHLPALHDAVVDRQAHTVVELGVRDGQSTAALLAGVHVTGGHLWSVDVVAPPGVLFDEIGDDEHWSFVLGNDVDPMTFSRLPTSIDVLFIDTDHAWSHTVLELCTYGPAVRAGGLILLHDTENEHPEDRGEPIGPQDAFPVRRAIDEFCAVRGLEWSNDPQSWGLGTIYV